ncbi:hypothetical protein [Agrobacterium tumefaciens]|uniref:hypothetical protein n=1 Tax=Agrobacterium tumefaciens TaxID=358 RepID=UPI0021D0BB72|nr:hypothetical protein [Agrobacterium tumefaciens]UXS24226.1 hypothetical protein FY153_07060 [Agrobacterium tumefaciens]UXS52392.1 hypothetical protein FY148_06865 [Agrobacterium tumefaciens]UXS62638.1 hypothetical protein FY147_06865 [Agrobacterium tumefaciens]
MSTEGDETPIEAHAPASESSLGIHVTLVIVVAATFSTFAWEVYHEELGRLHSSGWLLKEDDPVDFWISTGMWTAIFIPVCWQAFKSSRAILRIAYGKFGGLRDQRRDEVKNQ